MTTCHECIPLDAPRRWSEALHGIPHGFTHTWEYSYAMHLTTGHPTFLYRFESGDTQIVCPLAERPADGYVDIVTPAGISGFTGTRDCAAFRDYWREFVKSRGYVCGYIGLHPLFDRPSYHDRAVQHNSIYVLDLTLQRDDVLARMDRNRKRELKRGHPVDELVVLDRSSVRRFLLATHEQFMQQARASAASFLSQETLSFLCDLECCLVVGAGKAGRVEAAYVFGRTPYAADCLVNVSKPAGRRHTTALVWYGITHFQECGVPILNLGGGVREDDSIARAKQRFGGSRLPLCSLTEVYRPAAYANLCRRAGVPADRSGYFPAYRREGACGG